MLEVIDNANAKPWEDEPDSVSGKFFGLPCVIRRNEHLKTLNGYVGVSKSHRFYGINYTDIKGIDVHGGLTFSTLGHYYNSELYYWLGFDCNHYTDFIPGFHSLRHGNLAMPQPLVYRDIAFVCEQTIALAYQLSSNHANQPKCTYFKVLDS